MRNLTVIGFCTTLLAVACSSRSGGELVPSGAAVTAAASGYTVRALGTLGGSSSAANSINQRGWAMGTSLLHGNAVMHAALWKGRTAIDLKTLGGPNSAVEWPVA